MKRTTFLFIIVLCIISVSCGRINSISPISISFDQSVYDATFYTSGETEIVTITSELGEPEISIDPDTHFSISYNPLTGRIEWTEELPIGENIVTVVATLESAQSATEIVINNRFEGTFSGGYNFDTESAHITSYFNYIQFNSDLTLTLEDDGEGPGTNYPGSGTWSVYDEYNEGGNETVIEFTYSYDGFDETYYTFKGSLTYDESEAYISGLWYNGSAVVEGMARGHFRIDFQE